jgi:type II secretory pathway component GspD/PulD (secretin)
MPSPPVVFYLKYTKPDDALRMLAELLDGGQSAKESETGTLVNGFVSSAPSNTYYGSIVTSSSGTTTLIAGTITVVADSRLNRLIAQGTTTDIELIESYLEIVDKDSSITSIETYGTSHVIELEHTPASEVAAAIREAYVGRVAGVPGGGGPNPSGPQQPGQRDGSAPRPPSNGQQNDEKRSPVKKPGAASGRPEEPQFTIAVHEPSNSLIVTAPDQLFKEVEALAKMIDARNEQSVDVLEISNPAQVEFLQQFLSGKKGAGSTMPKRTSPSPPSMPAGSGR